MIEGGRVRCILMEVWALSFYFARPIFRASASVVGHRHDGGDSALADLEERHHEHVDPIGLLDKENLRLVLVRKGTLGKMPDESLSYVYQDNGAEIPPPYQTNR